MEQHLSARALSHQFDKRNLNEADTRALVIDPIIHDVLDWPRSAVKREVALHPGYADYFLSNAAGTVVLVIEAKREGSYFCLPRNPLQIQPTHVSLRSLLTDDTVRAAITQVRNYALDIGCQFACITNGHEWIVFRVFEPGTDWRSLKAYVIPVLSAFDTSFVPIYNALSYRTVSFDGSLNVLLSKVALDYRETFRPALEIPAYTRTIQSNKYVQYLRPIADRYFGVIDVEHAEFMEACYVSDAGYEDTFRSAQHLLSDSLTPYLESYGVRDTKNDAGGGAFGNRVEKSVLAKRTTDVVVLFGGKGIGKSTFLKRLLFLKPPQVLRKNAVTVMIDLLHQVEDKKGIEDKIWNDLVAQLDLDKTLSGDRTALTALFADRYELALKQDLYGISPDEIRHQAALNDLVRSWRSDLPYVARRLKGELQKSHRGVVVVIDNTDQYTNLQEYCFTIAQQISRQLGCLVIVSMREERFFSSSIHGVLDAFQNSGFHLSAPDPGKVFIKRLSYVRDLLQSSEDGLFGDEDENERKIIIKVVRSLLTEFQGESSHLSNFLTACAHGNIRLALELFRGLLQSRYTNIDEIASRPDWTWQIHQVLKPVMIPNRFFYDESQSHVPNIFQVRGKSRGSHFTILRIMSLLHDDLHGAFHSFQSLAQIVTSLSNRFRMEDEQRTAIDTLLRYGLIEADTRVDEFSEDISSVRLTSYGRHIFEDLAYAFTYIDLVATDTALFDSGVSSELARKGMEEYEIWNSGRNDREARIQRVEVRVRKATEFVNYLEKEEEREAQIYGLTPAERFTPKLQMRIGEEVEVVRRSAQRQRFKRLIGHRPFIRRS